jgi:hypothetical protein
VLLKKQVTVLSYKLHRFSKWIFQMKLTLVFLVAFSCLLRANELQMKVIHIGAGLRAVTKMPNDKFIVFDVGGDCALQ